MSTYGYVVVDEDGLFSTGKQGHLDGSPGWSVDVRDAWIVSEETAQRHSARHGGRIFPLELGLQVAPRTMYDKVTGLPLTRYDQEV